MPLLFDRFDPFPAEEAIAKNRMGILPDSKLPHVPGSGWKIMALLGRVFKIVIAKFVSTNDKLVGFFFHSDDANGDFSRGRIIQNGVQAVADRIANAST